MKLEASEKLYFLVYPLFFFFFFFPRDCRIW